MAVRFSQNSDAYLGTTGMPTGTTATALCWVYISVSRATTTVPWSFLDGVGTLWAALASLSDGTTVAAVDTTQAGFGPTAFTVGTWYRTAIVMNGTSWTFHRAAAGATITSTTATQTAIPTSTTQMPIGTSSGFWLNGRIANLKVYSAALTVTECEGELSQYQPIRTSNLLRFHPFLIVETADHSGNGNTLTAGATTPTKEDGPPIVWDCRNRPTPQYRAALTRSYHY